MKKFIFSLLILFVSIVGVYPYQIQSGRFGVGGLLSNYTTSNDWFYTLGIFSDKFAIKTGLSSLSSSGPTSFSSYFAEYDYLFDKKEKISTKVGILYGASNGRSSGVDYSSSMISLVTGIQYEMSSDFILDFSIMVYSSSTVSGVSSTGICSDGYIGVTYLFDK